MEKYVLSIDQGTTSSRAILFDKHSHLIEKSQREIKLVYPHNGWVEADPIEIWISVLECVNEVLIKANITIDDVECIVFREHGVLDVADTERIGVDGISQP